MYDHIELRQAKNIRFHDHGDTIAIQYGGSHLVNTMETYRKINQWSSHSRDMVESFKRYYNNSFLDGQRQEAYNLFLGNYIFTQGQPLLWDLPTDYYLHHADPRSWLDKHRHSYVDWFTESNLNRKKMPNVSTRGSHGKLTHLQKFDDYWLEYYRPSGLSSFAKLFTYRMNSTLRYTPSKSTRDGYYDLSPFRIRDKTEQSFPESGQPKKGVKIVDPCEEQNSEKQGTRSNRETNENGQVTSWLDRQRTQPSILKDSNINNANQLSADSIPDGSRQRDNNVNTQWTFDLFVVKSLDPSVSVNEMTEYSRYVSHPLNLPLVVSTKIPPAPSSSLEYLKYIHRASSETTPGVIAAEDDIADYTAFIKIDEEPLTVTEADLGKKRYKAYRQWLKGKSLFKQSRIDP